MRIGKTLAALALLAIASGCTGSRKVAQVGDFVITKSDVEARNRIIKVYFPQETRDLGLQQLTRLLTLAQVLKNNGHKIDDQVLEKEAQRIDKTTLAPEMLAKIKDVFKKGASFDRKAYLHDYVLPVYAERVIYYEFFLNNPALQKPSRDRAEAFLAKITKDPGKVEELAKAEKLGYGTFLLTESGIEWEDPRKPKKPEPEAPNQVPADMKKKLDQQAKAARASEAETWTDKVMRMKVGQVYPEVIDYRESWLVVRLKKRMSGAQEKFRLEAVHLPKADYATWLDAETKKVPVTVAK